MGSSGDASRPVISVLHLLTTTGCRIIVSMTLSPAQESSTPSLLAKIARRLTKETALTLLGSESPRIRRMAADWLMARVAADEIDAPLSIALQRDDAVCLGALEMLWRPDLEPSERLHQQAITLLRHPLCAIRRGAVSAIVRRWAADAMLVLAEPECCRDPQILRSLCLADDPKLIVPLLGAFGFPDRVPPPTIGFLVSATWLAEQQANAPRDVEWLIRECGYCDSTVTSDVLEMLSLGLSTVISSMEATGPADRWGERVRTFSRRLLSSGSDAATRDVRPLDLHDPVDTTLFLAAVRDVDRLLLAERRANPAWDLGRLNAEPTAVCFHAPIRHARRLFLDDARRVACGLGVSEDDLSEFVVDHARSTLEVVPERRIEIEKEWYARWQLRQQSSAPLRSFVIGDFRCHVTEDVGSPCAQSVCSLAELAGFDVDRLEAWLQKCERRWSRLVTPIGIELQIPGLSRQQFGPWKEALVYLGVPSPDRPEFGGMLEAAFRPARSWHAAVLAPWLLDRLGIIPKTEAAEIALHISLQGDLDHRARYLAFPQLFINRPTLRGHRSDATMTRVMSKGLVHRNTDIEQLGALHDHALPGSSPNVRTELRVFRLHANDVAADLGLSSGYFDDLVATHLLGSAMLSDCRACREVSRAYCDDVATTAAQLGSLFERLLRSNYYESTGDPRDEVLMNQLAIFQAWSAVRHAIHEQNCHSELRQQFLNLRSRHMTLLIDHFTRDHGIDWSGELQDCADILKTKSPRKVE